MRRLLDAALGGRAITFGPHQLLEELAPGLPAGPEDGEAAAVQRRQRRRQAPLLVPCDGEVWAGLDEAGRGPLAGPLVVCALVAAGSMPQGLNDSKALSALQRARLWRPILQAARDVRVAVVPPAVIDALRIHRAALQAMAQAAEALQAPFDCLWVDGPFRLRLDRPVHQHAVVDADARIACVAAASVVAKVVRDAIMQGLDRLFPGYGLARHKGYATPEHRQALQRLGPSPVHRASFRSAGQELIGA